MRTERRCAQRKRPGGISYFEFEAGSGGIVLDASEKGLGFQAADAVHQVGPSRIWISPRPEERIELTGDVVWTDTSRKTGGLRIIEAGADSTKRLRDWLGSPEESEVSLPSEGFPLPSWATQILGDLHGSRNAANPPPSTVVQRPRTEVRERPIELHSIPGLPSLFTSGGPWQREDYGTSGGRIAYRIATGFLMVVLAAGGVVLLGMFRPKVGESLIHLGEKINGRANLQPQSTSPEPSSVSAPTAPTQEAKQDADQIEAKPEVAEGKNSGDSALPVEPTKQVNPPTPGTEIARTASTKKEASNDSPDHVALYLTKDRSAEATRLWSAVASGDSSAEVDLARLYLRGEGVPRNCLQAKVLLRAAAKGGSTEARQQLKKLRSSGCR
ncbi:MAG TPA: hypothetical protein VJN92_16745 [Candidatus Acidoferrum sp.]|nr:hypothetical protein [Candidatus Acidoferrum sp.]